MKAKEFLLAVFITSAVAGCAGEVKTGGDMPITEDQTVSKVQEESVDELAILSEEISFTEVEQEIQSYLLSEQIENQLLTAYSPRISPQSSHDMTGMEGDNTGMGDGGMQGDGMQGDGMQDGGMRDDGGMQDGMRDEVDDDPAERMGKSSGVPTGDIGEGIDELKKRAPEKLKKLLDSLKAEEVGKAILRSAFAARYCALNGQASISEPPSKEDCQTIGNWIRKPSEFKKDVKNQGNIEKVCSVTVSFQNCKVGDTTVNGDATYVIAVTTSSAGEGTPPDIIIRTSVSVSNLTVEKDGQLVELSNGAVEISTERQGKKKGRFFSKVDIRGKKGESSFSILGENEFEKVVKGPLLKRYYAKVSYQESATAEPVEVIVEKTKKIGKISENTFELGITDTVRIDGSVIRGKEMALTVERGMGTHTTSGTIKVYKKDGRVITIQFNSVKLDKNCLQNPVGGSVIIKVEGVEGAEDIEIETKFRDECTCEADVEVRKGELSATDTVDMCNVRMRAKEKMKKEIEGKDDDEMKEDDMKKDEEEKYGMNDGMNGDDSMKKDDSMSHDGETRDGMSMQEGMTGDMSEESNM